MLVAYPNFRLTNTQKVWLGFSLTGILLTNSVNWSANSRVSLGLYSVSALSWMFRHSKIDFEKLLSLSVHQIIRTYGIRQGVLVLDDTDNERSKNAKFIHALGKVKDKASGGYFKGQNIVFSVLVTEKVNIPVGFRFYQNDPLWLAWKREDERLRKRGVKKKYRPVEVTRDYENYPTKQTLGVSLVKAFKQLHRLHFPTFELKAILADCFYGTKSWCDKVSVIYPKVQIISQLKCNQIITVKGKSVNLVDYFGDRTLIASQIVIRGGEIANIYYSSVVAKVKAHGKKRLIVAYKYEGEQKLRYVFATDLTWTVRKVISVYTLRWLVEVFIQDWKLYEGWANLSKHTGEEGSNSSLSLSLMFDYCLLLHPKQQALVKNNLPAATVGSLRQNAKQEHSLNIIRHFIDTPNSKEMLIDWINKMETFFHLKPSTKHMVGKPIIW